MQKKKFLHNPIVVGSIILAAILIFYAHRIAFSPNSPSGISGQGVSAADQILASAFANHTSKLQVTGQGVVDQILPDDVSGTMHQRFVVRLGSGQTILIAHNINAGSRISGLHEGDTVRFYGEYEWNNKGGVVHWTHREEKGPHVGGWLEVNGRRYE
jgi:hypothetical protein